MAQRMDTETNEWTISKTNKCTGSTRDTDVADKRKSRGSNRKPNNRSARSSMQTKYRKEKIEKCPNDAKYRLCKTRNETVSHIVSECS